MAPTTQPSLNIQQLSQSLSRAMSGGLFNAASSAFENTKETRNYIVSIDTSFKRTEKAISSINKTLQAQINSNKFRSIEEELERNRNLTGEAFNRLERSLAGILALLETMGGQQPPAGPPGGFPMPPGIPFPRGKGSPSAKELKPKPNRPPKGERGPPRGQALRDPKSGRFVRRPVSLTPQRARAPKAPKPLELSPGREGRGYQGSGYQFGFAQAVDDFRVNPSQRGSFSYKLPTGKIIELTAEQNARMLSSRSSAAARLTQRASSLANSKLVGRLFTGYVIYLEGEVWFDSAVTATALYMIQAISTEEYIKELTYITTKFVSRVALGIKLGAVFAPIFAGVGAKVVGASGAAVGSIGAGVGAIPGSVIGSSIGFVGGGFLGAYVGYELGSFIAENLVDLLAGKTTFAKLFNDFAKKFEFKATTEQGNYRGINVLGAQPSTETAPPLNILGFGAQNPETMERPDVAPKAILGYGAQNTYSQDMKFEGPPGERMSAGRVEELQQQVAAIRRQPISGSLRKVLETAAAAAGVNVQVTSGGQPNIATGSRNRTGSTRHDDGNAADLQLYVVENGKKRILSDTNADDRLLMSKFVSAAVGAGATGVGAAHDYMGPSTIHVGFGNPAVWGGSSGPASWIRAAASGIGQRGQEPGEPGAVGAPGQVAPPAPTPSLESPDEAPGMPPMSQPVADRVSMADPVAVDNTKKPQPDYDPKKYSLASFAGDVSKHDSLTSEAFSYLYGGGFGAVA